MDTSANIIIRKGAVSLSGQWLMSCVPCPETQQSKLRMKDWWKATASPAALRRQHFWCQARCSKEAIRPKHKDSSLSGPRGKASHQNKLETRSVPSLVSIPATSTAKPQSTTSLSNGLPSGVHFPPQDQRPQGPISSDDDGNQKSWNANALWTVSKMWLARRHWILLHVECIFKSEHLRPRSPERRFSLDTDYRISSVASDCSSEGSLSCGSSDSYVGYNGRPSSAPRPAAGRSLKYPHAPSRPP